MLLKSIMVGPLQTNCYILGCKETFEAIIVDPGADFKIIRDELERLQFRPKVIANTHAHIDHIGAIEELKDYYDLKFGLNEKELLVLNSTPAAAAMLGLDIVGIPEVDFYLKEGDIITLGKVSIKVIETPGHTKGSVCFLGDRFLLSGDTLFQGSIGRTDLPGGSYEEIFESITKKIFTLKDSIKVYPGHGNRTSIRVEKKSNPFFQGEMEKI